MENGVKSVKKSPQKKEPLSLEELLEKKKAEEEARSKVCIKRYHTVMKVIVFLWFVMHIYNRTITFKTLTL